MALEGSERKMLHAICVSRIMRRLVTSKTPRSLRSLISLSRKSGLSGDPRSERVRRAVPRSPRLQRLYHGERQTGTQTVAGHQR